MADITTNAITAVLMTNSGWHVVSDGTWEFTNPPAFGMDEWNGTVRLPTNGQWFRFVDNRGDYVWAPVSAILAVKTARKGGA